MTDLRWLADFADFGNSFILRQPQDSFFSFTIILPTTLSPPLSLSEGLAPTPPLPAAVYVYEFASPFNCSSSNLLTSLSTSELPPQPCFDTIPPSLLGAAWVWRKLPNRNNQLYKYLLYKYRGTFCSCRVTEKKTTSRSCWKRWCANSIWLWLVWIVKAPICSNVFTSSRRHVAQSGHRLHSQLVLRVQTPPARFAPVSGLCTQSWQLHRLHRSDWGVSI